eukprot:TRINITY_DN2349_c0_g1_i1.p1 TRINITY_DN2349_c0_g1~~TRINITY_DN2349_c0_g1_i1.p1  ORF type:complete len:519 (+),score=47.29 TRINITY_DN2349_c0_g1_i1:322-1878(+)
MAAVSRSSSSSCAPPKRRSKKEPKIPADIVAVARPMNVEAEKHRFYNSDEEQNYEPQFLYRLPRALLEQALRRYSITVQVEKRFVPHALRILRNLLDRYGSYASYQQQHGGEVLSIEEARPIVDQYLQDLGVESEIRVNFDPELVACASFVKKASILNIRPQGMRRNWIQGMLHHEVGTHFLRDRNDKTQPWAREKNGRKKYRLEDKNPTEEGLASLHTVLEREGHCLWRAALLYYATWRALELSFRDLYDDLAQFLGESHDERWDYCVRAKRGLIDTSQPGGFAKDQMYLIGAMEILEQRRKIDFNALYAGKLSVLDAHRAKATGLANVSKLHLPVFLKGAEQRARYLSLLDEVVRDNNLSDLVDGARDGADSTATGVAHGGTWGRSEGRLLTGRSPSQPAPASATATGGSSSTLPAAVNYGRSFVAAASPKLWTSTDASGLRHFTLPLDMGAQSELRCIVAPPRFADSSRTIIPSMDASTSAGEFDQSEAQSLESLDATPTSRARSKGGTLPPVHR